MTDNELTNYRLDKLEEFRAFMEDACRTYDKGMTCERIDRERLANMQAQVDRVERAQKVTDEKQDEKLSALAKFQNDDLKPRMKGWDEAVANQKKLAWLIVGAVLADAGVRVWGG